MSPRVPGQPPEKQTTGYEYEFLAARNAIIMGKVECNELTHVESRDMLRFMDTLRKTWKISFPLPEEAAPEETEKK